MSMSDVRPLTRAQQEALDWIKANKRDWFHPWDLPAWIKNPTHRCQLLERAGLLDTAWRDRARSGMHFRIKQ